jgi:hypothetical protein
MARAILRQEEAPDAEASGTQETRKEANSNQEEFGFESNRNS